MKPHKLTMLAMLALSALAGAADTPERTSPVDRNAACMDRATDASTGNCVVKDEGRPRRTYAPKPSTPVAAPASAPAPPASPAVRKSAVSK